MKQLFIALLFCPLFLKAQKQAVWLDADTGNEMDDLYAIAYLLKSDAIDLKGLSSAHFNNPDLLVFEYWNAYKAKSLQTVNESQRLNEKILAAMGKTAIPHPLGADRQVGRAWGQQDPRDSPAAQAMIAAARAIPAGQYLDVLTLGALTNVATAVMLAPDILPKIRCYALGARYDPRKKVWDKNEFNIRNDLNAFDYLLNLEGFQCYIMPLQAALPLRFRRDETYAKLRDDVAIERILKTRWQEQNPDDTERIMWDLALVAAYLRPDLSTLKTVKTPRENTPRKIGAYTAIDAPAMEADFWRVLSN
jgi:inosine-uridine nucleoside N-ribohydrolase